MTGEGGEGWGLVWWWRSCSPPGAGAAWRRGRCKPRASPDPFPAVGSGGHPFRPGAGLGGARGGRRSQIGSDDLLGVFVYQMPEMTGQVRVDLTEAVRLPMLKKTIPAAGLTASALAQRVAQELVAEGMARNPQVRVVVRQVMSRPIVVMGAVRYPSVLRAARPMRLAEVLARTGGLGTRLGEFDPADRGANRSAGDADHRSGHAFDLGR